MITRCKPLLGTFVEISIDQDEDSHAIDHAFSAIETIQNLMGFHNPQSELCKLNRSAHQQAVNIHPWTSQVLSIAQTIYRQSDGLFNCGIGHRLVAAGLLPSHLDLSQYNLGGIEDLHFLASDLVTSSRPVCLDLGGIAKGFAVDMAVKILLSENIPSGIVNAGGDLRVFGDTPKSIQIRNPKYPSQLIEIGTLQNAAIATTSLYFAQRDGYTSHIINPLKDGAEAYLDCEGSYSIVAKECIYADALTKVLALSQQDHHPCFAKFSARAIRIAA